MMDGSIRTLMLTVEARILPVFYPLLQDGFLLDSRLNCTIREFLRESCQLDDETIEAMVSTVLLDGMPVDDLDLAILEEGSALALSGAMPGLAGAVMRSNSPLRSLRGSITHHGTEERNGHREWNRGVVHVKLFNTVMRDLGPGFLERGILLKPRVLKRALAKRVAVRSNGIRTLLMDGESIDVGILTHEGFLAACSLISVVVRTHN